MSDSDNSPPEPNYDYNASKPAALIFTAVFGLCLIVHTGQAIRYRTLWVWPLIFGLIMETAGFLTRYFSIVNLYADTPDIISQVCIIVAPAFIAAQNYMLVGRLMSYLGKEFSPMSHALITKIFVVCDVISIFTQAASASMLNGTDLNTILAGFHILIAALAFQVIMFLIFVVITIVFDRRSRQGLGDARKPVQPLFTAFYISAFMIITRSIYRTFEFATIHLYTDKEPTGYTLTHEWLLYIFDSLPILASVLVLSIIHAGRYLPHKKGLRIDGTTEPPRPSRVCGCLCIYKRPRPMVKYDPSGHQLSNVPSTTTSQAPLVEP